MLIRGRKRIQAVASILLALFLVSSIASQNEFINCCLKSYGFVLSKTKPSSATNYQFPFEEKEKEEKQSAEEKSIVVSCVVESLFIGYPPARVLTFYTGPKSCGDTIHIPLYLFVRTLLI